MLLFNGGHFSGMETVAAVGLQDHGRAPGQWRMGNEIGNAARPAVGALRGQRLDAGTLVPEAALR